MKAQLDGPRAGLGRRGSAGAPDVSGEHVPGKWPCQPLLAPGGARAGAGHQPERAVAARPGHGYPGPGHGSRCRFLLTRTGDPGPAGCHRPSRGAGRAATRPGAGRRLPVRHRGPPDRLPGGVPGSAAAPARPRGARGYGKTVATTWSLAFGRLEQSAPSAVSLLRLLACCAAEAIPLSLLLRPRPGLAEELRGDVTLALAPLLDDPLAAGGAIAALR